jgi:hypothetical protein
MEGKTMTQPLPWWRRRFYVHPIQRKYFFLSLVPLIVCSILMVLLLFLPIRLAVRGLVFPPADAANLAELYPLAVRVWPAVLLSIFASGLLSVFVTHKLAGPLFRIEQVLRGVAEGNLPLAVRIRRDDDLQEFARLLNGAFGKITSALTEIHKLQARAVHELTALPGKIRAGLGDTGEILRDLEGINRYQREVERILAKFRLPTTNGDEEREH